MRLIRFIRNKFSQKSDFVKSVLTLLTGTAVAQFIPLAITPILTRLYSPSDFGLFSLYLSASVILSVVVTGAYEKAIIMPKENREAIGIIKLTAIIVAIVCVILTIVVIVFNEAIVMFYENADLGPLLYFIPISVFSLALYNVINNWFNRIKEYSRLSFNRITRSSISSLVCVVFGLFKSGAIGLVVAEFMGQFIATILFGREFVVKNRSSLKEISKDEMSTLAKEHKNFPVYSMPADLLSMASYQLPVFAFSKIFNQTIVGHYSLCIRLLDKPFVLLTSSIYEVFRQKAMEDYNNTGECSAIFKKTLMRLLLMGLPSMTIFFIIAPDLFRIVFGASWEPAGYYARIISIMYFFKFIASPLSFTFYIVKKQRLDFILHIYVFLSSLSVLLVSYWHSLEVATTLSIFVANYSFIYLFYLYKSYQFSHGTRV